MLNISVKNEIEKLSFLGVTVYMIKRLSNLCRFITKLIEFEENNNNMLPEAGIKYFYSTLLIISLLN